MSARQPALALLAEARARSSRLAEPYLWLDGYILDAQCDLGRRYGHPDTGLWVETLRNLAARSGMRELTLRSLQHGAALGRAGDSTAAAVLAGELAESELARGAHAWDSHGYRSVSLAA